MDLTFTNSQDRPHIVADHFETDDDGAYFWATLEAEWSGFDVIPYYRYGTLFHFFQDAWKMSDAVAALHDTFTVYRGQRSAEAEQGFSWTLDRAVAQSFADGHRGSVYPDAVVLEREVRRCDVAMYLTDREESEAVLWPEVVDVDTARIIWRA